MQNEILDLPFDEPQEEEMLDIADTGKRFVNYLIDRILLQVFVVVGFVLLDFGRSEYEEPPSGLLTNLALGYFLTLCYYMLLEGAFNGKTLGKLITRTRAVCEDGSPLTWNKAALRSLCRLIPFEPLSFFAGSVGWHDSLSKTFVVNDRRRQI
ncbi:MAG: RDD family protein [Saprospiraceae bacterium]